MSEDPPNDREPRYGGFWIRLGALFWDALIIFPLTAFQLWGPHPTRLCYQWEHLFFPAALFAYHVGCVGRWGGTPGKLLCGLRVVRIDLRPAGWKEAFLRESLSLFFSAVSNLIWIVAAQQISESAFEGYTRSQLGLEVSLRTGVPGKVTNWISTAWVLSEFVILLTNRKRRALHDFIAGTVVVRKPEESAAVTDDAPARVNP